MVQAAAAGRLDFSKADSDSTKWRARESIMLWEQEQANLRQLTTIQHHQRVSEALYCHPGDKEGKLYIENLKRADGHYRNLCALNFPWLSWDERSQQQSLVDKMRDTYVRKYGDPNSKEVQERVQQGHETLKRRTLEQQQAATQATEETRQRQAAMDLRKKSRYKTRSRGIKRGRRT